MKRAIIIFTAFSTLACAMPAFADDSSNLQTTDKVKTGANGSYYEKGSSSSSDTDANGTYTSDTTKVKADIDAKGNGKKTVTSTHVTDPKGLFNKTKTVTTDTEKTKNGKTQIDHEKTVNGSTVEKSSTTDSQ